MVPAANRKPRKRRMSFIKWSCCPDKRPSGNAWRQGWSLPPWPARRPYPNMRQEPVVAWFYVETEAVSSAQPRSGEPRSEELVDRLRQRAGIALAPCGRGQMRQIVFVRHVTQLDENRRHVGCAQHD